jgi:hypothetical protein
MQKTMQIDMANDFLNELISNYEELSEISAMDILDTLGCCGLSFTESADASLEFLVKLGAIKE